jgi:hypothetical protein
MTTNTKRAIVYGVFAIGLVLGLLGWMGHVYSSSVATILFIVAILVNGGLKILWGIKK